MKKLLILLCLFMLVSCSNASVSNPMKKYSSLEEINEITHGNIQKPAVMGVDDEEFYIIESNEDKIAQYSFTVSGVKYTIRFSDTILNEDISGVYINGETAFKDMNTTKANGEGLLLARWFTVDGQYVMTAEDSIDQDTFNAVVDEITFQTATR